MPRRFHRAFTLIELLVVIAIIALLIAILLPSLEAARKQSKKSVCSAHLKNIATTSHVYSTDDPQGWAIPAHPLQFLQDSSNPTFIGAYEWGGKSGIGRVGYFTGAGVPPTSPLSSKYGTAAGFGPASRPLNDILYPGGFKDNKTPWDRFGAEADTRLGLDLFKCPGDDGPPRGAHCQDWIDNQERSSFDHFGNSFAANVFLTGVANAVGTNSPYLRPMTRVPTPAKTLFYEENIGRWAWACKREQCDFIQPGVDPGPTKTLRGWHGQDWTYNRAFVDSHVEAQKIYFEGTEDADGYALHYRNEHLEVYPDWFDGSEGSFTSYRCIIVRGDGWQKDTMPAPVLPANVAIYPGVRPSYEDCVQNGN